MNHRACLLLCALLAAALLSSGALAAASSRASDSGRTTDVEVVDTDQIEADSRTRLGKQAATPLPDGVVVRRDLAYGGDERQRLDVYIPPGVRSAPILFMVHGGAWMVGNKQASNVVNAKVARWAPRGYIVVSTNYRLSRQPKVMDQVEDVARALAFTQANAASWGGDPARVLLMGHSAGAHLVTLLTAAPQIATAHGAKPWVGTVALDSAAMDVVQVMEGKHPRFYDRVFGDDRTFWEQVSPYHRVKGAPAAPMLLVCSSRREESCSQSKAFAARAVAAGGLATVLPVDLSHGETNSKLGLDNDYTRSVETFMRSLRLP